MQITHEEARRLIQFSCDERLDSQNKMILSTHLKDCSECRDYVEQIKEVEGILVPVMKTQWNRSPIPLSISSLIEKTSSNSKSSTMLITRMAMVTVVFAAFIFSAWQFVLSDHQTSNPLPAGVSPAPTPSVYSTQTKMMLRGCKEIHYTVQENDTLARIAYQFSTSKEEIIAINHLSTEVINRGRKLIIPSCSFTPTGTSNPTSLATIYTPTIKHTPSTPSG